MLWLLSSKNEEEDYDLEESDDKSSSSDENDEIGHVGDEHSSDCAMRAEDDEACVYSLERLLRFPSLCKMCGDIQRLKYVTQCKLTFKCSRVSSDLLSGGVEM